MPLNKSESVEELVDNFIQPLRRPITLTCRWYSYYYLSEIHDVQQADFELAKLTDKLYNALFDYGLYACYRELSNKEAHYQFIGKPLDVIRAYKDARIPEDYREQLLGYGVISDPEAPKFQILEAIKQEIENSFKGNQYEIDPKSIRRFLISTEIKHPMGSTPNQITSAAKSWEQNLNIFSNPRHALKLAAVIFDTKIGSDDHIKGNSGFVTGFGGEAWAGVAQTTLKYYDVTKKAFVDMMFQMEHNNGNLLNKTTLDAKAETEAVHDVLQNTHPEILQRLTYPSAGFPNQYSSNDVYSVIMPEILEMVRQEHMVTPLRIASKEDARIQRWAKRAGVL